MPHNPLVVVANRLPVDEVSLQEGVRQWRRSPGGLVSALTAIVSGGNTTWVGWAGSVGPAPSLPDLFVPAIDPRVGAVPAQ